MAAATIGALRVVLGADTAQFEDGLRHAQSRLSAFGSNVAKAGAALGVALAAAGAAIGVAVKHAVDEADKLGKTAQKIGIPVEELSRLKHAADLSDVSLEALGKSVGILSKNMSAVAGGAVSPAANAFNALKISVTNADGSLKSSTQVMTEVAAKFGRMEDGAGKTAIAMAIFGKSGADMIPLLNQGAAGLKSMMEEADKLGIVIDSQTARAAEEFNDNLKRLDKAKDGIILKITAGMLPAMQQLSAAMVQAAQDSRGLETVGNMVGGVLKVLATIAQGTSAAFRQMALDFSTVVEAIRLAIAGEFSAALGVFGKWRDEAKRLNEESNKIITTIWDAPANEIAAKAPDTAAKIAAPIMQSMQKIEEERKKSAANMAAIQKEQEDIVEKFRTPAEQMAFEIQKINSAFDRGIISQYEFGRAAEATAQRFNATWAQAGAAIAGSFAQIAGTFGKSNSAMATAAKAFAIVQAVISAYQGAAQALTLPFPANLAAAAAVLAKGFAFVAAIKSQNVPSFAAGGSFTVPGGLSRTDNMMVPMNLASGERVDVTPAGGASPRPVQEIVVRSRRPRDLGLDYLRELVQELNLIAPDGYRLVPA